MPVIISGAVSGATTVQATDAVTATITLPSATDTLVGKTTPSFTTTIGVGNATPSASGAGITFPATQSASTDPNTLDDYEEGTWTASLGGTATYSNATGYYTKIGNLVYVKLYLGIGSIGTGSTTTISGLPFTANLDGSTGGSIAFSISYFNALNISTIFLTAQTQPNTTSVYFNSMTTSGTTMTYLPALFTNNTRVDFTGVYRTT
jgi:hypothetical protein